MERATLSVVVAQAESLAYHLAAAVGLAVPTAAAIAPAAWQAKRLRESCERVLAETRVERGDEPFARIIADGVRHLETLPLERLERHVAAALPKLRREAQR